MSEVGSENSRDIYGAIARNLREFGYPDVTAEMVGKVHEAISLKQPDWSTERTT